MLYKSMTQNGNTTYVKGVKYRRTGRVKYVNIGLLVGQAQSVDIGFFCELLVTQLMDPPEII